MNFFYTKLQNNNKNNKDKVENITEFINQEIKNKYKYILSPVINYIYRNHNIDRNVRNYFSHNSHVEPKLLRENKKTILDILDDIIKNSPSSFAVQTFTKISKEYNNYIKANIYKYVPSLYKKGINKVIYNKEENYLEINDSKFIFRIPKDLWKYFFYYNEEKHFYALDENIKQQLRKKAFTIKDKNHETGNTYKNKKTMRVGQLWINELNLATQIPKEKEEYLNKYIQNTYTLEALEKNIKDEEIIQNNLKTGFFSVEKIKDNTYINFINKEDKIFFTLNIVNKNVYEVNKTITHYLVDLHSTKLLTKLLPLQDEVKTKEGGIYYLELERKSNKTDDVSKKLKNKLDILLGQNFSYSIDVIKCLFEFEEEFFIKEYNDEEHEYIRFRLESIQNKKNLIKELQKCGIDKLEEFFEELRDIRNNVFHGDFAPHIKKESHLQKLINYCKARTQEQGIKNKDQLSSSLYKIGIAIAKYSKREQFNPQR